MLEIRKVSKRFGGLQAVNSVSLDASAGEILGVIGPNGAGKSTLFNLVCGVHSVDEGSIHLSGQNVVDMPLHERARLGMSRTFQLVHVVSDMTVLENVLLGLYVSQITNCTTLRDRIKRVFFASKREAHQARDVLEQVGLSARADGEASLLSYGEQRLLEVARAIVGRPKLLLLDEPAAGMNAVEAERLSNVVRSLRAPQRAILLVEHNVGFVMSLSDRVFVLNQGSVLASGLPEDVRANGAVIDAYLGGGES